LVSDVITFNLRDFAAAASFGVTAVAPGAFWQELTSR
jgi:hypothetical protein